MIQYKCMIYNNNSLLEWIISWTVCIFWYLVNNKDDPKTLDHVKKIQESKICGREMKQIIQKKTKK